MRRWRRQCPEHATAAHHHRPRMVRLCPGRTTLSFGADHCAGWRSSTVARADRLDILGGSCAADNADPPVRELVTVAATTETFDLLIGVDTPPPQPLTRITLQAPTAEAHDLDAVAVAGNIVPAVQGLRQSETFVIPDPALPPPGPVVVRVGANWTPGNPQPDYRYCLASAPLAWLASDVQDEDTAVPAQPEILLTAMPPDGQESPWAFQRWLLGLKPAWKLLRWLIYWQFETRIIAFKYSKPAIHMVQNQALKFLKRQVADPELRKKLTPDFTIGCKRVLLSNTYYPALTRPNVTLHSREQGIAALDETGIVTTDGQHIDVDLIVWSTGYDATDGVISYPVSGKNGVKLRDVWAQYPRAYLGTSLPDFPNLFIVTGPNTGIGHTSALFIIESQMNYILDCIRTVQAKRLRSIEVRPEAERTYTQMIHREMERSDSGDSVP